MSRVWERTVTIGALPRVLAIAGDDESAREVRRGFLGSHHRAVEVPLSKASNLGDIFVKPFAPQHFVDAALRANVACHSANFAGKLTCFAEHSWQVFRADDDHRDNDEDTQLAETHAKHE
jgi:hypothetical protein